MPVKNMQAFIDETLKTIQHQSHERWELLIIDDHSEDRTWKIIQAYKKDPRIHCWSNPKSGILPALQLGLSLAKGEFITRMDGDDLMPTKKLEWMSKKLMKSDSRTIVTGKVKYFSSQSVSQGYLNYESWLNERIERKDHWKWIYRECVVASPNWMMRTNEFKEIGGFEDLTYPEDYDMMLRCYQHGFRIESLKQTTLYWREHPARTSRNSKHYNQESFFRLKILRFLNFENIKGPVFLIGTMRKGKLTAKLLINKKVLFYWFGRSQEPDRKNIYGVPIQHIDHLPQAHQAKALISIFPEPSAKQNLEDFLNTKGFHPGINCWYL